MGWLEGLFQGIQTALFAQQMAARAQLEQMRRGLPPGAAHAGAGGAGGPGPGHRASTCSAAAPDVGGRSRPPHPWVRRRSVGRRRYPRPVAQPVTTGEHRADDGGQPSAPTLPDVPGSRSWQRAFGDLGRAGDSARSGATWAGRTSSSATAAPCSGRCGSASAWASSPRRWASSTARCSASRSTTFLPYVATGLLIWNFISGCILEGSEVFIANEGLIRFLPAPISLHVYRLLWRQTLFFLHNLVIWLLLVIIFPQPLSWTVAARHPGVRAAGGQRRCGSRCSPASSPPASATSRRSSRA